jgi:hypothetical protein
MTRIIITSPDRRLEFDTNFIGEVSNFDTLVVTEIDPESDEIRDYVFKSVKYNHESHVINLISEENSSQSGIFWLVDFMFPDVKTLMKLFEKYDGKILAYNGENILMKDREDLDLADLDDKIYVVTCYNDSDKL